jgi:hypothetical protein
MAKFIEEGQAESNNEDEYQSLDPSDEGSVIEQDSTPEPEQQQEDEDIPEKYRGKDVKEIIRMHSEAEKLIGRQGSEVGELRRIVDDFIKAQATTKQQPQEEINEDDYFADPKTAIAKAIDNHPKIKQAEMAAAEMSRAKVAQMLQAKHPDYVSIVSDSGFQEWIRASKVRSELLVRADKQYDFDAADELFSTWKDRQSVAKQTVSAEKQARSQTIKSATTAVSSGSDEAPSKKVYRRADIIRLMQTDPDRYDAMQPEIMAAYAEGRVR